MNRPWPTVIVLAVVFIQSQRAPAQDGLKDPQALLVLSRSAAALRLQAAGVTSILASGTYTAVGPKKETSYPLRVKAALPDKVRWETDRPDGAQEVVLSGGIGLRRIKNKVKPLSAGELSGRLLECFPILAVGRWMTAPDVLVRPGGQLRINNEVHDRVLISAMSSPDADPQIQAMQSRVGRLEVDFSASSGLPVSLRYFQQAADWRIDTPVDLWFADYTPVDGLLTPMTIMITVGKHVVGKVLFQSFLLNVPVSDNDFRE